ncbi:hypothetical protein T4B_7786, partial [Trichinella pseudospiralis]
MKEGYGGHLIELSMRYLYADNQYISLCSPIFEFDYVLTRKEHRTCTPERPISVGRLAAYRQYWLQSIVEYMAKKGIKREFDIRGKLGFLIILRDWHKCRRHCSNILYINMLAIEHEEYSILISE